MLKDTHIRQISDIHLECASYTLETTDKDSQTVIVLAGDIAIAKSSNYIDFLIKASKQFMDVVVVAGNHEYWRSSIIRTPQRIREKIKEHNLTNVHYLEKDSVVIDGVAFVGGTGWTSNTNPITMFDTQLVMNDFKKIRHGTVAAPYRRKLTVADTNNLHNRFVEFIKTEVPRQQELGNRVRVVSHHAPTYQSIHPKFASSKVNNAYYTNLEWLMIDLQIQNWMHGHVHNLVDTMIDCCRVTCVPRGYVTVENTGFDPIFYLEK
jgi:predicted phosphohydrolase